MRIRSEYSVGRELKFLSNLDMMRVVERTIRRADIPYKLSEGFNPHIKMSMGTILPVGLWGTKEYFDVELDTDITTADFLNRMNCCFPEHMYITSCIEIDIQAPALMKIINAAAYSFVLNPAAPLAPEWPQEILARDSIKVMSKGKKKGIEKELRPGIYKIDYRQDNNLVIEILAATGEPVNVRFDELLELITVAGVKRQDIVDIYRSGNYIKEGDEFYSPLEKVG